MPQPPSTAIAKRPAEPTAAPTSLVHPSAAHPALQRAGRHALFAADEFFSACIVNPHTRRAYARAVRRFLDWCDRQDIDLAMVTPAGSRGREETRPGRPSSSSGTASFSATSSP